MDASAITAYLASRFAGVNVVTKEGDTFYIYDPDRDFPPAKQIPFITVITRDDYDTSSNLSRRGLFRVNIGVSRATYEKHFGPPPKFGQAVEGYDFTAIDVLLPHPIYAAMGWVCVVSPSVETFEILKPMFDEAYAQVAGKK